MRGSRVGVAFPHLLNHGARESVRTSSKMGRLASGRPIVMALHCATDVGINAAPNMLPFDFVPLLRARPETFNPNFHHLTECQSLTRPADAQLRARRLPQDADSILEVPASGALYRGVNTAPPSIPRKGVQCSGPLYLFCVPLCQPKRRRRISAQLPTSRLRAMHPERGPNASEDQTSIEVLDLRAMEASSIRDLMYRNFVD
ncbi:hypothetical protein B0H14DRAFT_3148637 [Mycena olivaceomarginata]|nr:hypothetical protein B0H14DRAFT_3148637 [Mycena olivaceomarginata]